MKHPDGESKHKKHAQQIDQKSWKTVLGEDIDFTGDVIEQMTELAEMHRSSSSTREDLYRDRIQDMLEGLRLGSCHCAEYSHEAEFWPLYVEVEGSGPLPDYRIECQGCSSVYEMEK